MPGETIAQKVARIVKVDNSIPSHLVPPNRDDLLAATHPSEHNSVFAFHKKVVGELSREKRRKKIAKRLKANTALVKAGRLDKRDIERSHGHDAAFLMPVPLYFYSPIGVGCVAAYGGVVNGEGGGGIGGCASVSHWTDLIIRASDY